MNSRLIRLHEISQALTPIVQFADYDEDEKRHPYVKAGVAGAALGGAGYGGYKIHQAARAEQAALGAGAKYTEGLAVTGGKAAYHGLIGAAQTAGAVKAGGASIADAVKVHGSDLLKPSLMRSAPRGGLQGSVMRRIGEAIKKGWKFEKLALSARAHQLVQLNARLDGVVELNANCYPNIKFRSKIKKDDKGKLIVAKG